MYIVYNKNIHHPTISAEVHVISKKKITTHFKFDMLNYHFNKVIRRISHQINEMEETQLQ